MSFLTIQYTVFQYVDFVSFPLVGQANFLYIDLTTNKAYTWNESGESYQFLKAVDPDAITSSDLASETEIGLVSIAAQRFAGKKTFADESIKIDSPSTTSDLEIGFFPDISPQAYGIRRSGLGGYFVLMPNGTNPQLVLGAEDNTTGAAYIDVDNNRPLFINVLDTGDGTPALVTIGSGGLSVIGFIATDSNTITLNDSGFKASIRTLSNTANRTHDTQDKSGVLAHLDDIADAAAQVYAEMYYKSNAIETPLVLNTPVKVTGATYSAGDLSADFAHSTGRLTYSGSTFTFKLSGVVSARNIDGGSPDYIFYFAKNGLLIGKSSSERDIGAAEANISFQCITELASTDYIEVFVENVTDNDDLIIQDLSVTIIKA